MIGEFLLWATPHVALFGAIVWTEDRATTLLEVREVGDGEEGDERVGVPTDQRLQRTPKYEWKHGEVGVVIKLLFPPALTRDYDRSWTTRTSFTQTEHTPFFDKACKHRVRRDGD